MHINPLSAWGGDTSRADQCTMALFERVFSRHPVSTVPQTGTIASPLTTKGDLFGYSTTNTRIPVGSDGDVLISNSANANGVSYYPLDAADIVSVTSDDFIVGLGDLSGSAGATKIGTFSTALCSGTSSFTARPIATSVADGMLGVVQINTGSTTGGAAIVQGFADQVATHDGPGWVYGSAQIEATFWFKTDSSLSDATNRYQLNFAMVDGANNTIQGNQYGIFVQYRDDLSSGQFRLNAKIAGVNQTAVASSTTVAASTKYVIKLVLNAARTQVDLYIRTYGGTFPSSPDASYTGTLPNANQPLGPQMSILKSAGNTPRSLYCDRWQVVTRLVR